MIFKHIVQIQVFIVIIPADHIEVLVIVEHIVRETTYFGKIAVSLHEVRFNIKQEALLGTLCLVETTEDEDVLAFDGHAHS